MTPERSDEFDMDVLHQIIDKERKELPKFISLEELYLKWRRAEKNYDLVIAELNKNPDDDVLFLDLKKIGEECKRLRRLVESRLNLFLGILFGRISGHSEWKVDDFIVEDGWLSLKGISKKGMETYRCMRFLMDNAKYSDCLYFVVGNEVKVRCEDLDDFIEEVEESTSAITKVIGEVNHATVVIDSLKFESNSTSDIRIDVDIGDLESDFFDND